MNKKSFMIESNISVIYRCLMSNFITVFETDLTMIPNEKTIFIIPYMRWFYRIYMNTLSYYWSQLVHYVIRGVSQNLHKTYFKKEELSLQV